MYQSSFKKRNKSLTEAFSEQILKTNQMGWSQILPLGQKRNNGNTTMSSMMYKAINKKNNLHKRFLTVKIQQQFKSSSECRNAVTMKNNKKHLKDKQNSFFESSTNLNIKILKLQKKYLQQQGQEGMNMFPKDEQFLLKEPVQLNKNTFYRSQIPQLTNININSYTINNMPSQGKYKLNLKTIPNQLSSLLNKQRSTTIQNLTAKKYFSRSKIKQGKQQIQKQKQVIKDKAKVKIQFVMPFRKYFKANRKRVNNGRCFIKMNQNNETLNKLLNIQQN